MNYPRGSLENNLWAAHYHGTWEQQHGVTARAIHVGFHASITINWGWGVWANHVPSLDLHFFLHKQGDGSFDYMIYESFSSAETHCEATSHSAFLERRSFWELIHLFSCFYDIWGLAVTKFGPLMTKDLSCQASGTQCSTANLTHVEFEAGSQSEGVGLLLW